MTNQLAFRDTKFNITNHSGQIWLRGTEIAKSLGMEKSDAISQIYNRNSDEFTEAMTLTLKLSVKGFGNGNSLKDVRVFSLRGAHLIAMFARTPVAKEFRRWVLDILDREVAHSPIAKQFSDEELQSLCWLWRSAVRMASHIADVEPLLRVAEHRLAGAYYSMPREYSRNMSASRALLERETMHVPVNAFTQDNWRVLNSLRASKRLQ